jgi:opacity protein-like surface antigen
MNAGCYLDIWLTRHHKGTTFDIFEIDYYSDGSPNYIDLPTFDTDVAFVSLVDNRLQVGLLVGTGFDYQITEKVKVFTEVRYLYSLSGLTKDSSQKDLYNKYNRTIVCQLGAMYCF